MKKVLVIGLIAFVGFLAVDFIYNSTLGNFWISGVSIKEQLGRKEKTFRIGIDSEASLPHSMDLKIKGDMNGKAVIGFGWQDSIMYKSDTVESKFEFTYNADWYSDTCFVFYKPLNAQSGEMLIECAIHSSMKEHFSWK